MNNHSNNTTAVEKLPPSPQYGRIAKKPLIEQDDESDSENDPIHHPRSPPSHHQTKSTEQSFQTNIPPPLAGMWRYFSDQFAREDVQKANQKPASGDVKLTPAATALDMTFDDESQEVPSIHALPDENQSHNDSDDDEDERSTPAMMLFQDTFSESQRDSAPYLDPELDEIWRRTHSKPDDPPLDIPKIVSVPSQDSYAEEDAPEAVSIEGHSITVKHGMAEVKPGEFVRIHGRRHAQNAIAKGQSIIVQCDSCGKRFQVARKATALYCTNCNSVTRLTKQLSHSI